MQSEGPFKGSWKCPMCGCDTADVYINEDDTGSVIVSTFICILCNYDEDFWQD